ncbi:CARDB domain-containing protein [Candidatus Laterigemmans baculatus]|uniref:CARDB domain-containing protein n=1 Tax=Candidatus Laterigemmans baculatus TaxID=2770505 RepID=UPI0013D8F649|nr:CARDB domain-containing protein [Candidatus Laterigemmans baculatus]
MRRTCYRLGLLGLAWSIGLAWIIGLAGVGGLSAAGAPPADVPLAEVSLRPLDGPAAVTQPAAESSEDAEAYNAGGAYDAGEASGSAAVPAVEMPHGVRFGSDVPSLRVHTEGPDTLVVGKPAEYQITLANQSEFAAGQVSVRVQIPSWVELNQQAATAGAIEGQAAADDGSGQLVWRVERLAARGVQTLTLMLVPRAGRAFDLGVDVSVRPSSSATKIAVKEPKLELRLEGTREVVSGEPARWTITVANPGTGEAQNVRLELFSGDAKVGTERIDRIAAGDQRIVDVALPTPRGGPQQLRAVVVADPGLSAETSTRYWVRRGELGVHVQGPAFEYAGSRATYEVRVRNTGDAVAKDVRMQFMLPPGAKYIGRVESGAADPQELPAGLQWTIASIAAGSEEAFRIGCELSRPGNHRATVQAVNAEGLQAAAEVHTQVEASADLQLQVIDPPGPRAVGSEVEIEIRVTNRGTAAARRVYISALCDAGTELVDVTGSASIEAGQIFFQPLDELAAGETFAERVTIRAADAGGRIFRVTVESEEPKLQLACDEHTRFFVRNELPRHDPRLEASETTRTAAPLPLRKIPIR